jgi:hypothetical protein
MLEYYKEIVLDYMKENHPRFYREMKEAGELDQIVTRRVENFLDQMSKSSNPEMDKGVFYQDMLTFY